MAKSKKPGPVIAEKFQVPAEKIRDVPWDNERMEPSRTDPDCYLPPYADAGTAPVEVLLVDAFPDPPPEQPHVVEEVKLTRRPMVTVERLPERVRARFDIGGAVSEIEFAGLTVPDRQMIWMVLSKVKSALEG